MNNIIIIITSISEKLKEKTDTDTVYIQWRNKWWIEKEETEYSL